ncbi:hypothetical protein, partial [Bacillus mycoides]|uniref:hypothetical protein n=1 Tax=Bacillus mycoides TaxID=1405 RepID=UPI002112D837
LRAWFFSREYFYRKIIFYILWKFNKTSLRKKKTTQKNHITNIKTLTKTNQPHNKTKPNANNTDPTGRKKQADGPN